MKVTDLEKFVLEQIFWPCKCILTEEDIKKLNKKYNLDTALTLLKENREWRKAVMYRLSRINLQFPTYINHPLVEFIKVYIESKKRINPFISKGGVR